jgi:hypothetical protein
MHVDIIDIGHKWIVFTPYAYSFSYSAETADGQVFDQEGEAAANRELSELELQLLILSDLSGRKHVPVEDMIITRFHYVSLSPMSVGVVSLVKRDTGHGQV